MARVKSQAVKTRIALDDLIELGKKHYIFDASLGKTELIRKIQIAEGHFDCYAMAGSSECNQLKCSWREDCLLESAQASQC
jgi:hypothetical protein